MVVTVVIPTRDRRRFLDTATKTALSQEGVDTDVIVVDDGSREEVAARPGVRLVRHEKPRGVAVARNRGLAEARGEWTAFLDDDDLWSPLKLRRQLDAATAAGAEWAYAEGVLLGAGGRVVKALPAPPPEHLAETLLVANLMPVGSSNVIARTELLRRLGGFDERLSQLADWDLWIRLALAAPAAVCREMLVAYVGHSSNMLVADTTGVLAEFDHIRAKHGETARSRGVAFDEAQFMRFVAFGHRREGRRLRAVRAYLRGAVRNRDLGNLGRAAATLLGERALGAARRLAGQPPPPRPDWLDP